MTHAGSAGGGYTCVTCNTFVPFGTSHFRSGRPFSIPTTVPIPTANPWPPIRVNWKYCPHCGHSLD